MTSSRSGAEIAAIIRVRGRWLYQVNGSPITNDQHIAVSYGRREDAEQMLPYWMENGHWIGKNGKEA